MFVLALALSGTLHAATPYGTLQGGVYGVTSHNPVAGRCLFGEPESGCFPVVTTVVGRLGLQIDTNWAAEATVGWTEGNTTKLDYREVEWFPELNARYTFNPESRVQVFATAGAGITHTKVDRPNAEQQTNDDGFPLYRNPSVDGLVTAGPGVFAHVGGPVYVRSDFDILLTIGSDPTPDRTDVWGTWRWLVGFEFRAPPEKEEVINTPPPCTDTDADGICEADKCPTEPEDKDGFEDSDGCIDPDNDQDGILDVVDKCPMDPEDKDGFEDVDGCPDPDNDKDGFADVSDTCPNEPETKNGYKDGDGCPDEAPPFPMGEKYVLEGVYFDFDRDNITAASDKTLQNVLSVMTKFPDLKVEIQGHTDSKGDDAYNIDLSQRRAESVVNWLVEHGISRDRLRASGFGETRPIDTNETSVGRAKNRRVEIHPYE